MIHLAYNSEVSGANIRAQIVQLIDTGLGLTKLFWQDNTLPVSSPTAGQFVTEATAVADRSYPVTEQLPAEDAPVAYYGNADDSDMTYTGKLIIGYHDAGNDYARKYSEIRYFKYGKEVSFTIADDRTNRDISRIFVFELSKRKDRTYAAKNPITISTEDDIDFTFNLPSIVPSGVVVSKVLSVDVSPSGQMAVESLGPQGAYPVLSTSGGQVAGQDYTVSCLALMDTGETYKCRGILSCVA